MRLPKPLIEQLGLGLEVDLRVEDGTIVIAPIRIPRAGWAAAAAVASGLLGAAGIRVIDDLRGTTDAAGRELLVTLPAVADEIAGATDLVKGKAAGLPVAVVRGLGHLVAELDEPGAAALIRPAEQDMFRLGSEEAEALGYARGMADAERRCFPDNSQ